ncbi:Required for respiratory growth protein 9 mitochondrial [Arthrobotrys megalospora]
MTCTQCTTRILRSLVTDLSIPSTATTKTSSRRTLNRLPRTSITRRYTSSSTPRHQSAEVNLANNDAATGPDFLGMYNTAKKNPNKEALAMWGSSWKTETDLSSMRDHEIRLPESSNNKEENNEYAANAFEKPTSSDGFSFLDDFTSLPPSSSSPKTSQQSQPQSLKLTQSKTPIPQPFKSHFPTRSSENSPPQSDEIPWEDADRISKKISTPHNPTANAWKEWSTPALWSHARMQELYKPKTTNNGIRITKYAALTVNAGELKWNPSANKELSLDHYRTAAGVPVNNEKKIYDKDTPEWKIHKDAVMSKLRNKTWNPFSRLSPAAVATLKQLKQENPGMTVEEYAPIFKISPDALRRILKSKWTPTPEQEADRIERWKRRGKNVWQEWEEKGLVVTKKTRTQRVEEREVAAEREKQQKGFVVRRGLNLKNRIL